MGRDVNNRTHKVCTLGVIMVVMMMMKEDFGFEVN